MALTKTEANAEVYYHGTHKHWFDEQVETYGRYQQPIDCGQFSFSFVGLCFEQSTNYARDRAKRLGHGKYAIPIVLKIDGDKVRGKVYEHPRIADIGIDFLNLDEFEIVEVGWGRD